jgi:hypothetical protein
LRRDATPPHPAVVALGKIQDPAVFCWEQEMGSDRGGVMEPVASSTSSRR